jgi:hypothetical protein
MFAEFKEISARTEVTFAENGYVIFVSGQNQEADWINKVYVYAHEGDFHDALSRLAEIPSS